MVTDVIGIELFDYTKILINTDDKLPDDFTLKNVVVLMTCIVKYDDKFYPNKSNKIQ